MAHTIRHEEETAVITLREVLQGVASAYSEVDGGAGQALLEHATTDVNPAAVPAGWAVRPSRRIGQFTHTPWLGFFDPDETIDPKVGLYVCWIFEPDLRNVVLSIQQGTESLTKSHGGNRSTIPDQLRGNVRVLRDALGHRLIDGLAEPVSFGTGARQVRYAAGSVAHRRFRIRELPSESELLSWQGRFCNLLGEVIAARNATLHRTPGTLWQSVPAAAQSTGGLLDHFKPKSSEDYLVHVAATTARRHRRHESIVNDYARWATDHGWITASPHPVDLRLRLNGVSMEKRVEWTDSIMFEAKVVRRGNVTQAVREVIGQLATYPYIVVPADVRGTVRKAGLFSEAVGDLWIAVLEKELQIATIWWEGGRWKGGELARSLGLAE